jgi:hypothetical protein
MSNPQSQPQPNPPEDDGSASGKPSTPGSRLAFQVWAIFFLLVITFGLLHYVLIFFGTWFSR